MNSYKNVLLCSAALALMLSFSSANAGICSRGVIDQIKEGGWNSSDLFIRMDYRHHANEHAGTEWHSFMRFRADELSPERLNSIRSLAYIALATGPRLFEVRSSTGDCSRADEVTIYDDAY